MASTTSEPLVFKNIPYPGPLDYSKQAFVVPGSQKEGSTGAYRDCIWAANGKFGGTWTNVTLQDLWNSGLAKSRDHPCLGHRELISTSPVQYAKSYTWQTYAQVDVRRKAIGSAIHHTYKSGKLQHKGDFECVGIWSANRPEWQIVDLACQAYGKVSVSLYDTLGPDAVEFILNHAEIPIAFVTNQHLPTILTLAPKTPHLKMVVSIDPLTPQAKNILTAWGKERGVEVTTFEEFEAYGRANLVDVIPAKPDDITTICYTSGTTSNPKGALLTHGNLATSALSNLHGAPDYSRGSLLSYLPLAHIYERVAEQFVMCTGGAVGYFTGDPLRLLEDAQILKPLMFPSVPRVLNRLYMAAIQNTKAPGIKGALFRKAIEVKTQQLRETGTNTHKLWDALVFRKVQAVLGGQLIGITSGSAPISVECMEFLKIAFACDVREGYGLTESSATCLVNWRDDKFSTGTVGAPQPVNEVKLADVPSMNYTSKDKPNPRGEICIRGLNIFQGYYKDEKNTKEAFDEDGWFHTGDVGEVDSNGRFKIIDRIKNIMKLAQGEYVALEKVENVYTTCPVISQIYVHGDGLRDHLLAVVVPDPVVLAEVAGPLGVNVVATDPKTIEVAVKDAKVVKAVLELMNKSAKDHGLKGFETAKGLYLTADAFTVENNLLTPTFKIRRRDASLKYKELLDSLFPKTSA